jgi:hypothetical protein
VVTGPMCLYRPRKFNARMRAHNFTEADLPRLMVPHRAA